MYRQRFLAVGIESAGNIDEGPGNSEEVALCVTREVLDEETVEDVVVLHSTALTEHRLNLCRCCKRCSSDILNHFSSGTDRNEYCWRSSQTPSPINTFSTSCCCCFTSCFILLLNRPHWCFLYPSESLSSELIEWLSAKGG